MSLARALGGTGDGGMRSCYGVGGRAGDRVAALPGVPGVQHVVVLVEDVEDVPAHLALCRRPIRLHTRPYGSWTKEMINPLLLS